jgi:phosphoenolpyruvate synthase/pyruvate phosphate dikinase
MPTARYVRWFREIGLADVATVGGKNASLGELFRELTPFGIRVPDGFAVTAEAYRVFLASDVLGGEIRSALAGLDTGDLARLAQVGRQVRERILSRPLPEAICAEILAAYAGLCREYGPDTDTAVRSSATAEDLPSASFAGQQESFLNVRGERELLDAVRQCIASLFTDRAISYRVDKGFDHFAVALSVGVQKMVRSDLGAAIVSREIGVPCVVGTSDASSRLPEGRPVTVSCAEGEEGVVYDGLLPFAREQIDLTGMRPQDDGPDRRGRARPEGGPPGSSLTSGGPTPGRGGRVPRASGCRGRARR